MLTCACIVRYGCIFVYIYEWVCMNGYVFIYGYVCMDMYVFAFVRTPNVCTCTLHQLNIVYVTILLKGDV